MLRKLAQELDLSLEVQLKAAGYSQVACMFKQNEKNSSRKSTKDLQNSLNEYRHSQMDLLDDAYQKRNNVIKCRTLLHSMILKLEIMIIISHLSNRKNFSRY